MSGSMTHFVPCPACGRENPVYGTEDWCCAFCKAVIYWDEENEEIDRRAGMTGLWAIKQPPAEGVPEALERGEDPFTYVHPSPANPFAAMRKLAEQRHRIATDGDPVTLGEVAKDLGVRTKDLVDAGQRLGFFDEGKGGSQSQLNLEQLMALRDMVTAGFGRAREPVEV